MATRIPKKNRFLNTAGKKKVSTRKKQDKSKIFDKLPSLNKILYAYKIYNNANNPTIRTNGHSFIKIIEETKFEKVDFTINGLKAAINDVDDGAKSSGKNIMKYKTLSVLNFDDTRLGEFDLFSPTPLNTGEVINSETPNIFTYEEGDSINEIDPITNLRTDSSDESVSLISFSSQAKLKTEVIEIEKYASIFQIPEFNEDYKLKQLLIETDVNFGLNRIFARGRVAHINKFFNLKLDDAAENKFLIVKSFTTDEDMFDCYEPYFDPAVTMFWEEQHKFFAEADIKTIFNVNDAVGKAQYDLVIGAHALSWLLKNNFEGIVRNDLGILTGSCRGVSFTNLDRATDKSIVMADAIDYWLQFIPIKNDKNKALRILAALSNGILNNKYVFPGETSGVNVPWHLTSNNLYSNEWIDRSLYPAFNIKSVQNIYTLDDAGKVNGIISKWKELSRIKYIETGINEVSIDFLPAKAQKADYSPNPGENDTKDIAKDFIMYPIPNWQTVEDIFSETETVLYNAGDEKDFIQLSTARKLSDISTTINFYDKLKGYIETVDGPVKIEVAMQYVFQIMKKLAINTIKSPIDWTRVKINSELIEIDGMPEGDDFQKKYHDELAWIAKVTATEKFSSNTSIMSHFIGNLIKNDLKIKFTSDITYKANIDIVVNNSKNTYITDEEIITDRQLALFGVNKHEFEVVLDESQWNPGTVLSSMFIKNKYGTELKITKIFEYKDTDGALVEDSKEYLIKLGSGQSPENQLTEIGFGV